jgi:hypothetical protein
MQETRKALIQVDSTFALMQDLPHTPRLGLRNAIALQSGPVPSLAL